uniref:Glycerol kinase 5 n=1 Tax=Dracunculus medinensis TaxID=318479 RepID=A0A0N4U6E7_DRAME
LLINKNYYFIVSLAGDVHSVASLGISCQRNTFVCWNRENGEICHRFVTWKDLRGQKLTETWNKSFFIKMLNAMGCFLYFFTRQKRFKAAHIFSFMNAMVTFRLIATIEQNVRMKKLLSEDKLVFGCLDTWLIYKLSGGKMHITEPSNASSTGMFDPYLMDWGHFLLSLVSFPNILLPTITYSAGQIIAVTDERIFGFPLSIGSLVGDQQAAAFACGCWHKGDINISLGTGSFIDVNTDTEPHLSIKGLYPLVGWKFPDSISFLAEGFSNSTVMVLQWAKSIGLFSDVQEISRIVESATDSACSAFIGIQPNTTKEQMLRAILKSIAFRIYQIWNVVLKEINFINGDFIKCCGGVSGNNFICQMISTLLNHPLQRIKEERFAAAKGAAMMAGITSEIWTKEDLCNMIIIDETFTPELKRRSNLLKAFTAWERALERCLNFYT